MIARRFTEVALVLTAACATRAVPREPEPLIREAPSAHRAAAPTPIDGDGDGVAIGLDACPDRAEDVDDHEDDDGCPDLDNDGDGRADGEDRCPDEPENLDGVDDADGCPEAQTVALADPVATVIRFRSGKAEVLDADRAVLDAVAQTLAGHPEVRWLEVRGGRTGGERRRDLDVARAQRVVDYLVARGIDRERLIVRGGGAATQVELRVRLEAAP